MIVIPNIPERIPRITYINPLPKEYANAEKNTFCDEDVFLATNAIAAMFAPRGHGLIEVSIPKSKEAKRGGLWIIMFPIIAEKSI